MWVSPDEETNAVDEEVPEETTSDKEATTMSIGGDTKKEDDKKTTTITKTPTKKNETKTTDEGNKTDFIEKYFHGSLFGFFIVLILMMIIGLEMFYIIYRIVKR